MILRVIVGLFIALAACAETEPTYDIIIRNGNIYDGLGNQPFIGDIAISGSRIAAIGAIDRSSARTVIDASGMAVSPGFINMLSWATLSLIEDGRAMSDIKQGVTLEVMGEGSSMGPWNDLMKRDRLARQRDIKYEIVWSTLGEYLDYLAKKGVSPNIASFVGADTVRIHEIGNEDRQATPQELSRMQVLVRDAMREGALGLGTSLIYAPGNFADTDEIVALVSAAAEFGGGYISHIRSESDQLEDGIQELVKIATSTGARAEIFHLKAFGITNWAKLDRVFEMVEDARTDGLKITANMYPYIASATGLNAAMPLWVQEGGHEAWLRRLKDPNIRARVESEMADPNAAWDNSYFQIGAENILLLGFKTAALKPLTGKTLKEVSVDRGTSPAATAIDLIIEDDSRVEVAYFGMSEENVRKKIGKPWISFGSDESAPATEGAFLLSNNHPRAYGTFARVLGKYVRQEELLPLEEAIRRMTSLPADNIQIRDRGRLSVGFYADVVVFDPTTVLDHATFAKPHQYATGVEHVFVNGEHVLKDGKHTGALPGQVVRGPGWSGWSD